MKKLISALLALALSASLCACGNTDANSTEDTTTGAQTTETTASSSTTTSTTATTATTAQTESEEEKQLKATKARYEKANEYLAEYLEDGYFYVSGQGTLRDNAAREYLYKEFEACGDYEDSEEILARFTVFPDMLTRITNTQTDNLGNVEESGYGYYKYCYDENGLTIYYGDGEYSISSLIKTAHGIFDLLEWSSGSFYYDGDRVTSVKAFDGDKVTAIATLEYDADGNIVKANIQTNDDTYTNAYTYDEENRLSSAEKISYAWWYGYVTDFYTYRYDEKGNLIQEIKSCSGGPYKEIEETSYIYDENNDMLKKEYIYQLLEPDSYITTYMKHTEEYFYDENSHLIKMVKTVTDGNNNNTITQFLYTNDENGRPISAELIETKNGKNSYASQILTYNYETLYFYNAE